MKDLFVYESYIDGKITKSTFGFFSLKIRSMECLELMHIDMYETFSVHAWREYEYFIIFINEYFKFG